MSKLPVWPTIAAALRLTIGFTSHHPLPVAVLWLAQLAGDRLDTATAGSAGATSFAAFAWGNFAYVLQTIIATPILLTIYRFALTGDARATYDILSPRGRRFLAANVVFVLCGVAVIGLIGAPYSYRDAVPGLLPLAGLEVIVLLAAAFYASARILLLFPLIAVDRPGALAASLTLTRGHAWRIFCISILPAIVAALAGVVALAPLPKILIDVLMAGIKTIEQIVFIATIALAYRWLAGNDQSAPGLTPVPSPDADPARS